MEEISFASQLSGEIEILVLFAGCRVCRIECDAQIFGKYGICRAFSGSVVVDGVDPVLMLLCRDASDDQ